VDGLLISREEPRCLAAEYGVGGHDSVFGAKTTPR
jgi:hypothetical protein